MQPTGDQNRLSTDFTLMSEAAGITSARSAEISTLLRAFISRMVAVPPTVWSGLAATSFRDAVQRWNIESVRLGTALDGIAETIGSNERTLRLAAETHAAAVRGAEPR